MIFPNICPFSSPASSSPFHDGGWDGNAIHGLASGDHDNSHASLEPPVCRSAAPGYNKPILCRGGGTGTSVRSRGATTIRRKRRYRPEHRALHRHPFPVSRQHEAVREKLSAAAMECLPAAEHPLCPSTARERKRSSTPTVPLKTFFSSDALFFRLPSTWIKC